MLFQAPLGVCEQFGDPRIATMYFQFNMLTCRNASFFCFIQGVAGYPKHWTSTARTQYAETLLEL